MSFLFWLFTLALIPLLKSYTDILVYLISSTIESNIIFYFLIILTIIILAIKDFVLPFHTIGHEIMHKITGGTMITNLEGYVITNNKSILSVIMPYILPIHIIIIIALGFFFGDWIGRFKYEWLFEVVIGIVIGIHLYYFLYALINFRSEVWIYTGLRGVILIIFFNVLLYVGFITILILNDKTLLLFFYKDPLIAGLSYIINIGGFVKMYLSKFLFL